LTAALPRTWSPEKVFFAITIILACAAGRRWRKVRVIFSPRDDFVLAAGYGASQARLSPPLVRPPSHIIKPARWRSRS
jgi:hypothetical protein